MPPGEFLLGVFAVGLVMSGVIKYNLLGAPFDLISYSEMVGGALPAFAVAALVSVPWRLMQRRYGTPSNLPVVVAALAVILLFYWTYQSALFDMRHRAPLWSDSA